MTNSSTAAHQTTRKASRDELAAYCQWLFMEHRLLCIELWPDAEDRETMARLQADQDPIRPDCRFAPTGTAAGPFHFPNDGRTWRDVALPSTRCLAVLDAIGLDANSSKRTRKGAA